MSFFKFGSYSPLFWAFPLLVIVLLTLLVLFRHKLPNTNSVLPKTLPEDISIVYGRHAGMLPESEGITLTQDSITIVHQKYRQKNEWKLPLARIDIEKVYQVFYETKFDKIRTFTEEVHDRGGSNIQINIPSQKIFVNISSSGMSFIDKRDKQKYNLCESVVQQLAQHSLQSFYTACTLELGPKLRKRSEKLYFNLNTEPDISFYQETQQYTNTPQNVLMGNYELQLRLDETPQKPICTANIPLTLTKTQHTIYIEYTSKNEFQVLLK